MRFQVEWEGVIEAADQEAADALGERIANDAEFRYRFVGNENAVLATMGVGVVCPKQPRTEATA